MLWKTDDCEAYKTFSREDFTVAIKRKVTPWTYIGKYIKIIFASQYIRVQNSNSPRLKVSKSQKQGQNLANISIVWMMEELGVLILTFTDLCKLQNKWHKLKISTVSKLNGLDP